MINQIKKLEPEVEFMLRKYPNLRDDDNRLYVNLIIRLDSELRNNETSVNYLLSNIALGKYPAFESVTRARRKVQEKNKELRGFKYSKRQDLEKEFRKSINE
jgi:hypothetical protein|tara:strand:+ start:86 stop:391 length:306 start_codon:yes stop_codon:yes gene_type:complete